MNVTSYGGQPVLETPHGVDVRKMFDGERAQVMEMKLLPGYGLTKHITNHLL